MLMQSTTPINNKLNKILSVPCRQYNKKKTFSSNVYLCFLMRYRLKQSL